MSRDESRPDDRSVERLDAIEAQLARIAAALERAHPFRPPLWCWECKSCGHERWSPQAQYGGELAACPGCKKPHPTWIGHRTGERSSCVLAEEPPP